MWQTNAHLMMWNAILRWAMSIFLIVKMTCGPNEHLSLFLSDCNDAWIDR